MNRQVPPPINCDRDNASNANEARFPIWFDGSSTYVCYSHDVPAATLLREPWILFGTTKAQRALQTRCCSAQSPYPHRVFQRVRRHSCVVSTLLHDESKLGHLPVVSRGIWPDARIGPIVIFMRRRSTSPQTQPPAASRWSIQQPPTRTARPLRRTARAIAAAAVPGQRRHPSGTTEDAVVVGSATATAVPPGLHHHRLHRTSPTSGRRPSPTKTLCATSYPSIVLCGPLTWPPRLPASAVTS
jgi:hypothetical protein